MLQQVKLTALRPLSGSYGKAAPGQSFTTDNETAEALMSRGLAERYRDPERTAGFLASMFAHRSEAKMTRPPENKMLKPPENKAPVKPRKSRAAREYLRRSEEWLSRES